MVAYTSSVKPNLGFRALAGTCLAMAQGIVGAPVMHPSATVAANNTKHRHYNRSIPKNVPVVLWLDHWGTYGSPPTYANWGHVVVYIPGKGFASSSPVAGEWSTPYYYRSIGDVERAFACRFRFWSEDLNGLRVCHPKPNTVTAAPTRRNKHMIMAMYKDAAGPGQKRWAVFGPGYWLDLRTQKAANAFAKQLGVKAFITDEGGWRKFQRSVGRESVERGGGVWIA